MLIKLLLFYTNLLVILSPKGGKYNLCNKLSNSQDCVQRYLLNVYFLKNSNIIYALKCVL